MVLGLLLGGFFAATGWLARPRSRPGELRANGRIVRTRSGWMLGDPTTLITVGFFDDQGRQWEFQPTDFSRGPRSRVGQRAAVAYQPRDPLGTARKTDGLDGNYHRWIIGIGVAVWALTLTGVLR